MYLLQVTGSTVSFGAARWSTAYRVADALPTAALMKNINHADKILQ